MEIASLALSQGKKICLSARLTNKHAISCLFNPYQKQRKTNNNLSFYGDFFAQLFLCHSSIKVSFSFKLCLLSSCTVALNSYTGSRHRINYTITRRKDAAVGNLFKNNFLAYLLKLRLYPNSSA